MSNLKGKNPRILLQERDDALGSHPTIARTGDKRLGNNKIWYDDRNTYIFNDSTVVSFPTAIVSGSKYFYDQTNLTSSIVATTRAPKSVEQSMVFDKQYEPFTPFNEAINFEQNIKDSTFYTNSDSLELFGKGFTNNIGSKTKITLEYPIAEKTLLSPTTASLYYYNFDLKRYEEIDVANKMNPHPNYNMWEARLFGVFGNNIASSSFNDVYNPGIVGGGYNESNSRTVSFIQNNLGRIMALPFTQSVCIDSRFTATSSQYIRLNPYINHPFLLEKMIVEIPIAVGPGWTNDVTTAWRLKASNGYRNDPFDIGGPCVVFSLLNQIDNNTRDVICSGSIIPSGDNYAGAFVYAGSELVYNEVFSRGFLGYASPAAVVNSNSSGFFTGSITMNLEPNISNGVFSLGFGGPPGGYTANDGTDFLNSFALTINPFGRSMKGEGSPRSYHGKEYAMPQKDQEIISQLKEYIDETTLDLTGRNAIYGYNIEANVKSPYLLYPNDNLLFCISKYRSIGLNSYITASAPYNFNNSYELQNTHDFTINTGSIKINLYGCLIKDEKEYHNTLNQRLDTNAIHEHIHEIHTDQLRLFYPNEFSGSIYSNFITGSDISLQKVLKDSTNLNVTDKLSNDSVSIQQIPFFEQTSFNDFVELVSNKNVIYDSMIPDFDGIMKKNNASINSSLTIKEIRFDVDSSSPYAINNWTKEFPFSKFYSDIKRTSKIDTIGNTRVDKLSVVIMENEVDTDPGAGVTRFTVYNDFADFTGNTSTNTNYTSLKYNDLIKIIYGFGDLNTYSTIGTSELNTQLSGTTNFANFRLKKYNHTGNPTPDSCNGTQRYEFLLIGPEIRGWKYGLSNGLPTYTKCIYRSDRYGQFSDRLEQGEYTKFYDGKNILKSPIQVRFVAPNGSTTLPEYTYSSNLSFECTSSYPYIEDKVTNREEPLNLNKIYSKVITSIDDV